MDDTHNNFDGQVSATSELVSLEQLGHGKVDVFFRPVPRLPTEGESNTDQRTPVRILRVDVNHGLLTMFPKNNLVMPSSKVGPKYPQIERISFAEGKVVYTNSTTSPNQTDFHAKFLGSYFGKTEPMAVSSGHQFPDLEDTVPRTIGDVLNLLEGLPRYCVTDPQFGLGFKRQYRAVVHAIENLTEAAQIQISQNCSTMYDEHSRVFFLSARDMLELTKAIERVDRTTRTAANTVNDTSTYNTLAEVLGLPKLKMRYGRKELRKTLTAIANEEKPLSRAEQTELVQTLTKNAGAILKREPATIEDLESGIAVARARSLREELEVMIDKNHSEREWQQFLQGNPFILCMVFGRPIVKVGNQASVGGKTISGAGDSIADFLVRNSLTNNAALLEIKTPKSKLLNESPYRRSVYAPAGELVGAINQVLDQKSQFEQQISNIRYHNRGINLEAHHVHACLLIGTMPSSNDRIRSFELFRHNLKDVVIVTYDELLRKVSDLCEFLEGSSDAKFAKVGDLPDERSPVTDDDLPF